MLNNQAIISQSKFFLIKRKMSKLVHYLLFKKFMNKNLLHMCVCVCVCVCAYVRSCVRVCAFLRECISLNLLTCVHACFSACVSAFFLMGVCARVRACVRVCR